MCSKPSKDVLELLIDVGLNLSVQDQETGNTLMHFGAQNIADTNSDASSILCEVGNYWEKKHNENNSHSYPLLDTLNFKGETPLMLAVVQGNCHFIEALLRHGVDLNRSAFGQPSLLHCLITGEAGIMKQAAPIRVKVAKLLLQHGASTNQVYAETGRTLLHEACCRSKKAGLVKVLLEDGHMDPNRTIPNPKKGRDPITPLMLAISQTQVETVELLIKRGAIVGESERKVLPNQHQQVGELRDLLGISLLK